MVELKSQWGYEKVLHKVFGYSRRIQVWESRGFWNTKTAKCDDYSDEYIGAKTAKEGRVFVIGVNL